MHNGAGDFNGEHIHFMKDPRFNTWQDVTRYLISKIAPVDAFNNVPLDPDTKINSASLVYLTPYWCRHETWTWGAINAHTLVFLERDVHTLTDNELIEHARNSGYDVTDPTVTRNSGDYALLNFGFVAL